MGIEFLDRQNSENLTYYLFAGCVLAQVPALTLTLTHYLCASSGTGSHSYALLVLAQVPALTLTHYLCASSGTV